MIRHALARHIIMMPRRYRSVVPEPPVFGRVAPAEFITISSVFSFVIVPVCTLDPCNKLIWFSVTVNDQMNWHHVDPLKCLSFDQ